jgi:hypothetical protein
MAMSSCRSETCLPYYQAGFVPARIRAESVKADTDSDPDVTNFTESSRHVASKSRQAVGVATGGASLATAHAFWFLSFLSA